MAPLIGPLAAQAHFLCWPRPMRRIWYFATDTRNLTIIGLTAMVALFYLGAQLLELALIWALVATGVMLLVAALVWLWRRWRAKHESDNLGEVIGANRHPRVSPAIKLLPRSRRFAKTC